jgi:hypothetical protein
MPDRPKKRKLWVIDPSMFNPGAKASFFERRILPPLRQIGKLGLYGLGLTYPIYLAYVGLAFGGLAFWSFFAISLAIIGTIITKLGYASNFRQWDVRLGKTTLMIILGFLLAVGLYEGLIYLKIWFVPVAFGLVGLGVALVLSRTKS